MNFYNKNNCLQFLLVVIVNFIKLIVNIACFDIYPSIYTLDDDGARKL